MTKKVLFAGYDFQQKKQRGIYLYAKSLISAVKSRGYETGVLSYALYSGAHPALVAGIFKSMEDPDLVRGGFSKYVWLKKYLLRRYLGSPKALLVDNPRDVVTEESIRYLDNIDFFYNIPNGYRIINIHDLLPLADGAFPLQLPDALAGGIFFTTSPMSIRSPGRKYKVIQTLHDTIPLSASMHHEDPAVFFRRLSAMNDHADGILAVSEYSRNQFLKLFPGAADRIKVVYQPVPADDYLVQLSADPVVQEVVLEKFGVKAGEYCFYIGAIEARKNVHRLIAAYTIAAKGLDVPLLLSGVVNKAYVEDRNIHRHFDAAATHGPIVNAQHGRHGFEPIRYVGYISELEKLCLIRSARAFLFPTINEGFGIPPLEAQTFGCPVLTSNVSSLPEVVGPSAYLVEDPYNLGEITTGIRKLLEDDALCATLREAGYKNAARFDKDTFAVQVAELIDRV